MYTKCLKFLETFEHKLGTTLILVAFDENSNIVVTADVNGLCSWSSFSVRLSLKSWAYYLRGKHFVLKTDHESLKYLHSKRNDFPKIIHWLTIFVEFDFEIMYTLGSTNRPDEPRIEGTWANSDGTVNVLQTVIMVQVL